MEIKMNPKNYREINERPKKLDTNQKRRSKDKEGKEKMLSLKAPIMLQLNLQGVVAL